MLKIFSQYQLHNSNVTTSIFNISEINLKVIHVTKFIPIYNVTNLNSLNIANIFIHNEHIILN